jgi:hypothetical protein
MKEKNQSTRNYSVIALVFALLACIATFFLGITRGLVSMQVFSGLTAEDVNRYLLVSAGLIILGLAAYAIMEPDRVRRFFTGRQARYGSNALIMTIAFVGILIVGNVLAYQKTSPSTPQPRPGRTSRRRPREPPTTIS